jgi:PEGA domain
MRKVLFVACGAALSACSAIPGMGGSDPVKLSLASNPSGADVNLSIGGSCKTPCTLPVPAKSGDYEATFTLAGYASRTVPIHVSVNREHWYLSETTSVDPKQLLAELQPITPPPQAKKR